MSSTEAFKADVDVPSTTRGVVAQDLPSSEFPSCSGTGRNKIVFPKRKQQWNLLKIFNSFNTVEKCIVYAEENGLILKHKICSVHKAQMSLIRRGNCSLGTFRCRKGSCRNKSGESRAKGTWFENSKLPLPQIFYLMYAYARHWSHNTTRTENFVEGTSLSSGTITDWFNYCREVVVAYQLEHQEVKGKIGGPGKVVQIDESKFGKRKFNKGKKVEGHWILGMIEDGSEDLRLEVCPGNVRSAEVLIPLIKKHVAEGTTIRTDFWKTDDSLSHHGYEHLKVNHTQRIDSKWRVVKRFFYKYNYNHTASFADMIVEFLWRNSISKRQEDPFLCLLEAIKNIHKT